MTRFDARPITIRDDRYPTVAAAARALGVTRSAIYKAEEYGYLDRVGLPRSERRTPSGKIGVSVTIRGDRYVSIKAAAEDLGVHPKTIRQAMERGNLDQVGLGGRNR